MFETQRPEKQETSRAYIAERKNARAITEQILKEINAQEGEAK